MRKRWSLFRLYAMTVNTKKRLKKTFLISISIILAVAVVSVLSVYLFFKDNPLVNVVSSALETTEDSFRIQATKTTLENGFSEVAKTEFIFLEDSDENGFAEINDKEYIVRTKEYLYRIDKTDGSESFSKRESRTLIEILFEAFNLLADNDPSGIARLLNKEVFSKDVLDEEKLGGALKDIIFDLADEDYLVENLGFSKEESNGTTIYVFKNDLKSLSRLAQKIVSESEYAFSDKEYQKELLEFCVIASELNIELNFELSVVLENGFIKTINQKISSSNSVITYDFAFSDFGKAEIDEEIIKNFEKHKNTKEKKS